MIKSMTGFGRGEYEDEKLEILGTIRNIIIQVMAGYMPARDLTLEVPYKKATIYNPPETPDEPEEPENPEVHLLNEGPLRPPSHNQNFWT